MNTEICAIKCGMQIVPKAIARYRNGEWYLFNKLYNNSDYGCTMIRIEPLDDFIERHPRYFNNLFIKDTLKDSKGDFIEYWHYNEGNCDFLLSSIAIFPSCNACKYLLEHSIHFIKHNDRSLKIRIGEMTPLSGGAYDGIERDGIP